MDFIDQLRGLASRIATTKDIIQTEEATKNAMVMPFIQALGYNVFDPLEVRPEHIADVGTKKGEKVDYAILRDGKPIIIFECKKVGADLSVNHASQLFRYFTVTEARFGILTNGVIYRFFTDLDEPNKMDTKPFLEFNLLEFKDFEIEELKKFAKSAFDVETILTTANELKYTRAIQSLLADWINNPSEDFVKLVSTDLLSGRKFTATLKAQFAQITKRAFQQLINDRINDRLRVALVSNTESIETTDSPNSVATATLSKEEATDSLIETTPEELEGFHIVRSILRDMVPSRRVVMRDALSYCAVLLDDNNRKTICRLRFNNTSRLVLGIMREKEEEKILLGELDELYSHSDKLKDTVTFLLKGESGNTP